MTVRCVPGRNWNDCGKIPLISSSPVQLLRSLHINRQPHMIFIQLAKIVNQNERIWTFQKLLKFVNYRNSSETSKIRSLLDVCSRSVSSQSLAILARQRCTFHYNSMRTRWIFNIFDYLNRAHFKLQNEPLIVSFTYWVQILLSCEIDEVAEELRDPDLSDEISQSYQI